MVMLRVLEHRLAGVHPYQDEGDGPLTLKELVRAGPAEREITRAYPPGSLYRLSAAGDAFSRRAFGLGGRPARGAC
jgi:hypothetical protein